MPAKTQNKDIHSNSADRSSRLGGAAETHSDAEIDNALRNLCRHGLVCQLRQAYFRTEADTRQMAEEKVYGRTMSSTAKGTRLKEEIAARVEEAIKKDIDSHIDLLKPSSTCNISQKRKVDDLEDDTSNPKRLKMKNRVATHEPDVDPNFQVDGRISSFGEGLIVRLNFTRIAVLFLNNRLLSFVTDTYGRSVSRTYEAVLKQLEPDLPDPPEETRLGPEKERFRGTSAEVDETRLAQDLARHERTDERLGSSWASIDGYVNGVMHRLTAGARSHLEILCEEPYRFLSRSLEHPDKYVVDYSDLSIHLRNEEVFRIIASRFDKYTVRIIRVLLDKGKIDEKYLQEIVLMSAKELRQALATLLQAGFLELQEVPREAQRQPSRTMYLWFYDPDRVRKMLIEDTYKCMARCLQRMKVEKEKIKPTIEKSERSDVRGKEETLLAKAELEVLKGWDKKEEWLLGEVGRLDELIFVLRDF